MPPHLGIISWHAKTHETRERSVDWYWALGLLAACGVVAAVIWGNLLFAVIIGIGALCIGIMAAREPRECEVHIDERGISIDNELYPYRSLHSFWVEDRGGSARLHLATRGIIHPHITLIIHEPARPEQVQAYLEEFLEEEAEHSIGSLVIHWFGL